MPLEIHWLTQCTLGYHWATLRILAGYTGTPLDTLRWNCPTLEWHWRSWLLQPTLQHHWKDYNCPRHTHTHAHKIKPSTIHARLKRQDDTTPSSKWRGISTFSICLEFPALMRLPVLLFKSGELHWTYFHTMSIPWITAINSTDLVFMNTTSASIRSVIELEIFKSHVYVREVIASI